MAKPSLVGYRRTSSDMDMSSSDEEEKNEPEKLNTQSQHNGTTKHAKYDESSVKDNSSSKEDRLRDDRRESERKESRPRDYGRRRKEYSDGKTESGSDRRKRKSPERSRGRHRSRSPGRRKHSPRDRKRSHSSEHHRPRKSRRSSRSPESFRSKRLERKVARIDKLGLEVFNDLKPGQSGGFYNHGGNPASRISEQIQKRRLLWGAKKEAPPVGETETAGTSKNWDAATFKGDNDGKMTEKFKRLMGIKGDAAPAAPSKAGSSLIQKQEEMFSNMEAQYQVARMATHTHRGIGLGFGTFQMPPR